MRIRVIDVLELLADGMTHEEILAQLPDLEMDDIFASLEAGESLVEISEDGN
jgi:uncharacterized protein (DUF433 family)